MAAFNCPHCHEPSISLKQKYRLIWWGTINCDSCDGRVAVFPWVLILMTMLHVWNIMWWIGMTHFNDSYHYLAYMLICWILIDLFSLYFMPLCRLKKKTQRLNSDG